MEYQTHHRKCDKFIIFLSYIFKIYIRSSKIGDWVSGFLVEPNKYHPPLTITIDIKLKFLPVINHRKYKFRRANYDAICDELDTTDWSFIVNLPFLLAILTFYSIINGIIHKHTPIYRGISKYPFWFDNELKNKLQGKERARKKWKRSGLDIDYLTFSDLRRECKIKIDECYGTYLNNLQNNIKLFWAFTKKKKHTNSYLSQFKFNDMTASNSGEICNLFATYFKSTYNDKPINHFTSHLLTLNQ